MHIGAGLSFYAMARRAKLRSRSLSKSQSALHACQKECDWLLCAKWVTHGFMGVAMCTYLISTPLAGHLAPIQATDLIMTDYTIPNHYLAIENSHCFYVVNRKISSGLARA
ncbi:hypothetical protein NC651_000041 [Populus alba x Populus x berolinensis]|nr:hypothetical protein NC651_000041 [Populus alba x Populus x berolinensis]